MHSSSFRAALRASAKVAFGLAVIGCGGAVASTGEPPDGSLDMRGPEAGAALDASVASNDAGREDAGVLDAGTCDPPPASSLLQEGMHPDASAGLTESLFDCCVARLETIDPGEAGATFRDAAASDPGVSACCAVVVARLDYDYRAVMDDPDASQAVLQQDRQLADPVVWECCGATRAEGPTCTPWGPPMPPAMTELA